jgi:hypothetical protein
MKTVYIFFRSKVNDFCLKLLLYRGRSGSSETLAMATDYRGKNGPEIVSDYKKIRGSRAGGYSRETPQKWVTPLCRLFT